MKDIIGERIAEHQKVIDIIRQELPDAIAQVAEVCKKALLNGNKLMFCGNGGSAADSQHLAAEFVGRFQIERASLPAIALTTDTSIITAVGNDYGFKQIFARQVEGLGQQGDVLFAISTSGESENVLLAMQKAKEKNITVIGMTGRDGGRIKAASDLCLHVPAHKAARVQEAHILIGHILCELLDDVKNAK